MKITTNFADPVQRLVKPLLVVTWGLSCAAVLSSVWVVADALDLRNELPRLRAYAIQSQSSATAIPQPPAIAARDLPQTRERVARINGIVQTVGVPSAQLLTEIESLMPSRAWLSRFHYRATEGEVRLLANASNSEPLSTFLMRLERSDLFEQAMLMREVHQAGDVGGGVQFEIRLKVRSW